MVRYPVRIPRESYQGSKANLREKNYRRNMLIKSIEDHLNDKISKMEDGTHVILSGYVAADMGLDAETVRQIIFGVDAGSNGFTVIKETKKL